MWWTWIHVRLQRKQYIPATLGNSSSIKQTVVAASETAPGEHNPFGDSLSTVTGMPYVPILELLSSDEGEPCDHFEKPKTDLTFCSYKLRQFP